MINEIGNKAIILEYFPSVEIKEIYLHVFNLILPIDYSAHDLYPITRICYFSCYIYQGTC